MYMYTMPPSNLIRRGDYTNNMYMAMAVATDAMESSYQDKMMS